jgi:hypothetical protein
VISSGGANRRLRVETSGDYATLQFPPLPRRDPVIVTRSLADRTLRSWGLKLREKVGFKRAAVAVARKLAVVMHTMLKTGELFDRTASTTA